MLHRADVSGNPGISQPSDVCGACGVNRDGGGNISPGAAQICREIKRRSVIFHPHDVGVLHSIERSLDRIIYREIVRSCSACDKNFACCAERDPLSSVDTTTAKVSSP